MCLLLVLSSKVFDLEYHIGCKVSFVIEHCVSQRLFGDGADFSGDTKAEFMDSFNGPLIETLGHYRYCGLPGNSRKLEAFRYHLSRLWYKTLLRRSQRNRLNWERMDRLINRWLPKPRIWHPYPALSLYVMTRGRSPCVLVAHAGIWGAAGKAAIQRVQGPPCQLPDSGM